MNIFRGGMYNLLLFIRDPVNVSGLAFCIKPLLLSQLLSFLSLFTKACFTNDVLVYVVSCCPVEPHPMKALRHAQLMQE